MGVLAWIRSVFFTKSASRYASITPLSLLSGVSTHAQPSVFTAPPSRLAPSCKFTIGTHHEVYDYTAYLSTSRYTMYARLAFMQ